MKTGALILLSLLFVNACVIGELDVPEQNEENSFATTVEEKKSNSQEQDDENSENDISSDYDEKAHDGEAPDDLADEGKENWLERMMKKVKGSAGKYSDMSLQERSASPATGATKISEPTDAIKEIDDALTNLKNGTSCETIPTEGAKYGLSEIKAKWTTLQEHDKRAIAAAVKTVATNFESFTKTDDDPVGSMQASVAIMSKFSTLVKPTGQIASVAVPFVSGLLSLYGVCGVKLKSVGQIVRKEIEKVLDKYDDEKLRDMIEDTSDEFSSSKVYVDTIENLGRDLTSTEAAILKKQVPVWEGIRMCGIIWGTVKTLLQKNSKDNAKKVFAFIELYLRLTVMKDMVLQETVAVLPENSKDSGAIMLDVQNDLRTQQKNALKFLFEGDAKSNIIAYFDPDKYPITDSYLKTTLKIEDYDRSLAGTWCIKPHFSQHWGVNFENKTTAFTGNHHPYLSLGKHSCFWKLVPHGKGLYTIINKHKCPDHEYCGQYMAHDAVIENGTEILRGTVEKEAILWGIEHRGRIAGGEKVYKIRNKWGCSSGNAWCDKSLHVSLSYFKKKEGKSDSKAKNIQEWTLEVNGKTSTFFTLTKPKP